MWPLEPGHRYTHSTAQTLPNNINVACMSNMKGYQRVDNNAAHTLIQTLNTKHNYLICSILYILYMLCPSAWICGKAHLCQQRYKTRSECAHRIRRLNPDAGNPSLDGGAAAGGACRTVFVWCRRRAGDRVGWVLHVRRSVCRRRKGCASCSLALVWLAGWVECGYKWGNDGGAGAWWLIPSLSTHSIGLSRTHIGYWFYDLCTVPFNDRLCNHLYWWCDGVPSSSSTSFARWNDAGDDDNVSDNTQRWSWHPRWCCLRR